MVVSILLIFLLLVPIPYGIWCDIICPVIVNSQTLKSCLGLLLFPDYLGGITYVCTYQQLNLSHYSHYFCCPFTLREKPNGTLICTVALACRHLVERNTALMPFPPPPLPIKKKGYKQKGLNFQMMS